MVHVSSTTSIGVGLPGIWLWAYRVQSSRVLAFRAWKVSGSWGFEIGLKGSVFTLGP